MTTALSTTKNWRQRTFLAPLISELSRLPIMEIGDRIRLERLARGLTQVELADAVGVNKSAVAQWESAANRRGITTDNLIKVARALAIPVARLTSGNDDGEPELVTLPRELALLRVFRVMSPALQDVYLKLAYVNAGLREPSEAEGDPGEGGRVTTRPTKQKA